MSKYEVVPFPSISMDRVQDLSNLSRCIDDYVEEGWTPLSVSHVEREIFQWVVLFKLPDS